MTSLFDQAAALTSAAVDSVYGEAFTFIGMKPGADRGSAKILDSSRPAFDVTGGFIDSSKSAYPHARGTAQNAAQRHVVTEPFASIDNVNMQWPAITGDRVTRLKTGEQYEIARPMPDGVTRTLYFLTGKTS
jgi:hypothetical protein